ncbi:MAG: hypothetical protein NT096_08970 [Proteobacteria bacterium]|nr:hypothetical protein [Pseudomonadota bacterium]
MKTNIKNLMTILMLAIMLLCGLAATADAVIVAAPGVSITIANRATTSQKFGGDITITGTASTGITYTVVASSSVKNETTVNGVVTANYATFTTTGADTQAPTISSTVVAPGNTKVTVYLTDNSGSAAVDISSNVAASNTKITSVTKDGVPISGTITNDVVNVASIFTPTIPFAAGIYNITLNVADLAGNTAIRSTIFIVSPPSGLIIAAPGVSITIANNATTSQKFGGDITVTGTASDMVVGSTISLTCPSGLKFDTNVALQLGTSNSMNVSMNGFAVSLYTGSGYTAGYSSDGKTIKLNVDSAPSTGTGTVKFRSNMGSNSDLGVLPSNRNDTSIDSTSLQFSVVTNGDTASPVTTTIGTINILKVPTILSARFADSTHFTIQFNCNIDSSTATGHSTALGSGKDYSTAASIYGLYIGNAVTTVTNATAAIDGSDPTKVNVTIYTGAIRTDNTSIIQTTTTNQQFVNSADTATTPTITSKQANAPHTAVNIVIECSGRPDITVGTVNACNSGAQIEVPVTISDTAGRHDTSFSVSFDKTKLQYTETSSGTMGASILKASVADINAAGKVQPIVMFEDDGATSGTIFKFKFTLLSNIAEGSELLLLIDDLEHGASSSSCSTWADVISTYNQYVSGIINWSDVIACYQAYDTSSVTYCGISGTVACSAPTLISLSSFTAVPADRKVVIEWVTESEIDNAGFNLYRAESEDGEYIKLNADLIPSEGSAMAGEEYMYIDEELDNHQTYYYLLEDMDLYGITRLHGPVSATPRRLYR